MKHRFTKETQATHTNVSQVSDVSLWLVCHAVDNIHAFVKCPFVRLLCLHKCCGNRCTWSCVCGGMYHVWGYVSRVGVCITCGGMYHVWGYVSRVAVQHSPPPPVVIRVLFKVQSCTFVFCSQCVIISICPDTAPRREASWEVSSDISCHLVWLSDDRQTRLASLHGPVVTLYA